MISFRKPSTESLRRILAAESQLDFTYTGIGTTAGDTASLLAPQTSLPVGYVVDRTRVELGKGAQVFESAQVALRGWQQFSLGWLEAFPNDTAIRQGETVLVLARAFGLWWTNAARIVYAIDEQSDAAHRFGFAYGTLPGHVESGEERFLIEWDRATDIVWFDILAFSRPRHFLSRLGYRRVRAMQKRFGQQSAAAMQRASQR